MVAAGPYRDGLDAESHTVTVVDVPAETAPPRFLMFTSGKLEPGYLRHLEHRIREVEPFRGSPIVVETRIKSRHEREG